MKLKKKNSLFSSDLFQVTGCHINLEMQVIGKGI